jgi:hypothetical protein
MRKLYAVHLLFVIALLAGCAQLGLPTAQTFEDKLTAGYALSTAVKDTATSLLNAKKISADDAQHVLDQTRNAKHGLDVARALSKTDLNAADSKVVAVRAALEAVQAYLKTRGG